MRASIKNTCSLIILAVFVVSVMLLLMKVSELDSTKRIKAIGYPRDTIMVHQRPCLVVEMHDYVSDSVYFDAIPINTRIPSTLEDFDPKWRKYRLKD